MTRIRLTKEFSFEMAHALKNYDGACLHIHGHSYKLFVTLIGVPISDETSPKMGMVMDFKTIKTIVNEKIISVFDHALVFNSKDKRSNNIDASLEKIVKVDFQPTCENLISMFAELISTELADTVKLHHLKLHETATSYAEWYANDNQ